jgi:hypothetical protein
MAPLPNPKWEVAALALAGGAGIHEAYLQAGFKGVPAAASRFFKQSAVRARVHEIIAEREQMKRDAQRKLIEDSTVEEGWIIRHLKHNGLAAMRGDPVYDRKGVPTGHYRPNREAANRSFELLGRTKGMFIDRAEVGDPGSFSRMADDELDKAIVEAAKELGLSAPGLKLLEDLTKKREPEDVE